NDVYPSSLGRSHGAIYLTENGGDHWERVLELRNASVVEICTSDPRVMYAGSIVGIYRSMDGGHSWEEVAGHLWGSEDVLAGFPIDMQCDPRDPMRIFINNYLGGNFLSEDGGQTWEVASNGYTGALLRQVGVSAGDAAHVYNASRMGVFVSYDYGDNWHGTAYFPARSPEGIIVAVDPFDGNHILSVFLDAGPDPKVSWDGGRSWSVINTGLFAPGKWTTGSFTQIVFSPYDANLVLATAGFLDCYKQPPACLSEPGYGVLRSTDRGNTWSQTSINDSHVFDLKFVSHTLAYAAAYPDTIYRSADGGQTWEVADQGITAQIPPGTHPDADMSKPILTAIAIDPFDQNRLLAGFINAGLMISVDGGDSWQISAAGLLPETSVIDIIMDAVNQGVVYLGSSNAGVFYSTDSGLTWAALNEGLITRAVTDLALSADGSVLYAATEGGGVWRLATQPISAEPVFTPLWARVTIPGIYIGLAFPLAWLKFSCRRAFQSEREP
ncbi:MAG: WD40/YVTN/BNR-like repeat-containing protein, partial [Anaerolineales bacterium]